MKGRARRAAAERVAPLCRANGATCGRAHGRSPPLSATSRPGPERDPALVSELSRLASMFEYRVSVSRGAFLARSSELYLSSEGDTLARAVLALRASIEGVLEGGRRARAPTPATCGASRERDPFGRAPCHAEVGLVPCLTFLVKT